MKINIKNRITSLVLSVLLVLSSLNLSTIVIDAASSLEVDYVKFLGCGYDVSSGKAIYEAGAINTQYPIVDIAKVGALNERYINVSTPYSYSEGTVISEKTLKSFCKEYTSKTSFDVSTKIPIKMVSIRADVKFDTSISTKYDSEIQELYEMYYQSVDRHLVEFELGSFDISKCLNSNFSKLLSNIKTEKQISQLFDIYGTHIVTAYSLGGRIEISNYTVSSDLSMNLASKSNFSSNVKANVGKNYSAEVGGSDKKELEIECKIENASNSIKYSMYGGSADSISNVNISEWNNSLKDDVNLVICNLPYSNSLVPLWELLPEGSEEIQNLMIKVYNDRCRGVYTEYCQKYFYKDIDYTKDLFSGFLYVSGNTGAFATLPASSSAICIGIGSIIYMTPRDSQNDYEYYDYIVEGDVQNIDFDNKNGVLKVGDDALNGKFTVTYMGDGFPICKQEFCISAEGDGGHFAGGYGDEYRPFLIANANQLKYLSGKNDNYCNKHYRLISDIDLEEYIWKPIKEFSGVFDGNGYRIYNFSIAEAVNYDCGFVAVNKGIIKNLTIGAPSDWIESLAISGEGSSSVHIICTKNENSSEKVTVLNVGAIAGKNNNEISNCIVENCTIRGQLNDMNNDAHAFCHIGGICGTISNGKINNSTVIDSFFSSYLTAASNSGDNNYSKTGGIAGELSQGIIEFCVSRHNTIRARADGDGKLKGKNNYAYPEACAGGLIGAVGANSGTLVSNCISLNNYVSAECGGENGREDHIYQGTIIGYTKSNECNIYTTDAGKLQEIEKRGLNIANVETVDLASLSYILKNDEWSFGSDGYPYIPQLKSNTLKVSLAKADYSQNDSLLLNGLKITGRNDSQSINEYEFYGILELSDIANVDMSRCGSYSILITTYGGSTTSLIISVIPNEISKITAVCRNNRYHIGENFKINTVMVTAEYVDGTSEVLHSDNLKISGFDSSAAGDKIISVEYSNNGIHYYQTSFTITVVEPVGISVFKVPNCVKYQIGDTINLTGLQVTANYDDGETIIITDYNVFLPTVIATGVYPVTISYLGKYSTSYNILVLDTMPDENKPCLVWDSCSVQPGKSVTLTIKLQNNPGVCAVKIDFVLPDGICIEKVENKTSLNLTIGTSLILDGISNYSGEEFLELSFAVDSNVIDGEYILETKIVAGDENENKVNILAQNGIINVKKSVLGDANGDGVVDVLDLVRTRRYLAGVIKEIDFAADMNGDGNIDIFDLIRLQKLLAN